MSRTGLGRRPSERKAPFPNRQVDRTDAALCRFTTCREDVNRYDCGVPGLPAGLRHLCHGAFLNGASVPALEPPHRSNQ